MVQIDVGLVLAQPFFLCSLILFAIGWFITFIAACTIGSFIHLIWVDIFYNLALLLGTTLAVATQSVHNYRLVILTFIGGSLSLLFSCIETAMNIKTLGMFTGPLTGNLEPKASAAGAGLIFQSFVLIFWVVYFGADEDSLAKRTINGFTIPRTPLGQGGANGVDHMQHQQGGQNLNQVVVAPAPDYAYRARALYTYEANPEDSNELSFVKGEILDIVDNKGKWWQARKQDGTIGIAPSNYLQLI
ncbi:Transmembrane osmosensor [Mortierella sp. NVP85]|nr:Transmembrane osmosensor [Mortierella sp. NVP85]